MYRRSGHGWQRTRVPFDGDGAYAIGGVRIAKTALGLRLACAWLDVRRPPGHTALGELHPRDILVGLYAKAVRCAFWSEYLSTAEQNASAPTASHETTTRAGRGVLSITASKLYFIVAGYAVQLSLPQLLQSPEAFGLYASAMGVVSILNNVIIAATIQTVSRQISAAADDEGQPLLRKALMLQSVIGGGLSAALGVGAPWISRDLLLDPLLTPLLQITAVVVLCYAVYATMVGFLNGRHRFQHQAALDLTYTTLRSLGILGAAALGLGAVGAVSGFALAAVLIVLFASILVGWGKAGQIGSYRGWLSFLAPVLFYQLCLNLILQIDLTLLKRNVAVLALAAGQSQADAAELASRFSGFYRGAQTFSFVPYQLILSVAFVVFPMVSQASALGDRSAMQSYIRGALRFSLLVLCSIAAPVSGASSGVLRIAYPEAYVAAADSLSILSIGMAAFALFVIAATIITGAGRPALSAGIAFIAVLCVVTSNYGFVFAAGLQGDVMWAAACGTSTGTGIALLLAALAVQRLYGAFLPLISTARILLSALVAFVVARAVPHETALSALLALACGGVAYLAALLLIRELGESDLSLVFRLVQGKRRS